LKSLSYVAVALIVGLIMLSPGRVLAAPERFIQPVEGPAVILAWVGALDEHDVEGALDLLAEESFLILSSPNSDEIATYSGKEEIREALHAFVMDNVRVRLQELPQEENGTTFWTEQRTSDTLDRLGIKLAEYVGEALVSDGKITSLIYTPTPETEEAIAQAAGKGPTGMPKSGQADNQGMAWLAWIGIGLWSVAAGICLVLFNRREARQPA
jgi:hypothetical protein